MLTISSFFKTLCSETSTHLQQTSPIQVHYKDPIHLNRCHQTEVEQSDWMRCCLNENEIQLDGTISVTTDNLSCSRIHKTSET